MMMDAILAQLQLLRKILLKMDKIIQVKINVGLEIRIKKTMGPRTRRMVLASTR